MDGFTFPQNHPQQNSTDKPPYYSIPTVPQAQQQYDSYQQQQQMNYQQKTQQIYNYQQPQAM